VKKVYIISVLFMFFIAFWSGCSEVNEPAVNEAGSETDVYFSDVETQLDYFEGGGMPLTETEGVFSIGWRDLQHPQLPASDVRGHAFAVVFPEAPDLFQRPLHGGIDMGTVNISFNDNQIELGKRVNRQGGIVYALRPFPGSLQQDQLTFIPDIDYHFEVSGSDLFLASTVVLHSPPALIAITSVTNGQVFDPSQDLTIEWTGGSTDSGVILHVLPGGLPPHAGPGMFQGRGNRPGFNSRMGGTFPLLPPLSPHGIVVRLDDNPGTYTFLTGDIQNLLSNSNSTAIFCSVSQWEVNEVTINDRVVKTVIQNGDRVRLIVSQ